MEQDRIERATRNLIDAVRTMFEAEASRNDAAAPQLWRVLSELPVLRLDPERPEARQLPVCRYLSQTLDKGEAGPAAPLAAAIRDLRETLYWEQNPRHSVEKRGVEFMENYAYTSFGLIGSENLYVGAMLLGPGITYPVTSYPPEGIFVVIGGSPEWKSGDQPWRRVAAGSIIYRQANGAEGKRPGKESMLALYAWLYGQD